MLRKILWCIAASALLALLPGAAMAQTGASGPVDPPPEFAQLRQQYEGLTPEQVEAAGYVPEGACVSKSMVDPEGVGAMGTHAINPALLEAQFPNGTMDPTAPPVLLLGQSGEVIGLEWEAADVGQGPMQMFGQTIQLQSGHPGVEEPHYMLHGYFKPGGQVLWGVDDQTAFDPDLTCPPMPATGGMVSPAQLGIILLALAGGLAVVGVTFVARKRLS